MNFYEKPALVTVRLAVDVIPPTKCVAEAASAYRKAFGMTSILAIPECKAVPCPLLRPLRPLPPSLVKAELNTLEKLEGTIEYDLDEEDQTFLAEVNAKRTQKDKIREDSFIVIMDKIEKETFAQMWNVDDADTSCSICGIDDCDDMNTTIFCDMCNIGVHKDCYGASYIPQDQWLCRKCQLSSMELVKCELCPLREGAFKPTIDGKWAHVSCAAWLSEPRFVDADALEPIEGVEKSLTRRQKLTCIVCKLKCGACVQCSKGKCANSFHVTCGMKVGLTMDTEFVEGKGNDKIKRAIYCHVHSSMEDDEFNEKRMETIEAINRSRQGIAKKSVSTPVPTINNKAKNRIVKKVEDMRLVEEIMRYWAYKRKKRGEALIRRSPVVKKEGPRVMTEEERRWKEKMLLHQARHCAGLLVSREKAYVSKISLERKMAKAVFTPLDDLLVKFIDKISSFDRGARMFEDDASSIECVGVGAYRPFLPLIREKAGKGEYATEVNMKEDLDLMISNYKKIAKVLYEGNRRMMQHPMKFAAKMNEEYRSLRKYLALIKEWLAELGGGHAEEEEVVEKKKPIKREKKLVDTSTQKDRKRKLDFTEKEDRSVSRPSKRESKII